MGEGKVHILAELEHVNRFYYASLIHLFIDIFCIIYLNCPIAVGAFLLVHL